MKLFVFLFSISVLSFIVVMADTQDLMIGEYQATSVGVWMKKGYEKIFFPKNYPFLTNRKMGYCESEVLRSKGMKFPRINSPKPLNRGKGHRQAEVIKT